MNKELINRYNNIAKYYNLHLHYKGYYDFLILKSYLSLFEKYLFIESDRSEVYHWYIDKHNLFLVDNISCKIYGLLIIVILGIVKLSVIGTALLIVKVAYTVLE